VERGDVVGVGEDAGRGLLGGAGLLVVAAGGEEEEEDKDRRL
jgi:hypothetical protein